MRRVFFGLPAALALLYSAFIPQVFAAALILAFGVRLVYVLLRWRVRPRLLSGWIFVIALGLPHLGRAAKAKPITSIWR